MKKHIAILTVTCIILILSGCRKATQADTLPETTAQTAAVETTEENTPASTEEELQTADEASREPSASRDHAYRPTGKALAVHARPAGKAGMTSEASAEADASEEALGLPAAADAAENVNPSAAQPTAPTPAENASQEARAAEPAPAPAETPAAPAQTPAAQESTAPAPAAPAPAETAAPTAPAPAFTEGFNNAKASEFVQQLNAFRQANGLPEVRWDDTCAQVAAELSAKRSTGVATDVTEEHLKRLNCNTLHYVSMYGPASETAAKHFTGLKNYPGEPEKLLDPSLTRIGVAFYDHMSAQGEWCDGYLILAPDALSAPIYIPETEPAPAFDPYFDEAAAMQCFELTNELRRSLGLPELVWDSACLQVSNVRAQQLPANCTHDLFWSEFVKVMGDQTPCAENIMHSRSTCDGAVAFEGWKNSPSHYAAMVNPAYTRVAITIYQVMYEGVPSTFGVMILAGPTP